MLSFIKKYWKGFLITLGVILAFIGGLLARNAGGFFPKGSSGNSGVTSGHEAADIANGQRIAENVGRIESTVADIKTTSDGLNQSSSDIAGSSDRLKNLADGLDKLASGR